MQTSLVTCIICTYKKFNTIYKTIDSVLNQSYPNIELFITDDGSPNLPQEEIKKYICEHKKNNIKKLKILTSSENKGTVRNLNKALKVANGEYCLVLAGDDCFYENVTISKVVKRMQDNQWEFIICSRMLCDNSFDEKHLIPTIQERKQIKKLNTVKKQLNAFATGHFFDMASGSSFYYKRDFIEKMGFYDERYRLWEDGPMFYKILKSGRILNQAYDLITTLYQEGGVSTTNNSNSIMFEDGKKFVKNLMNEDYKDFDFKTKRYFKHQYMWFFINRQSKLKLFLRCLLNFDIIFYNRFVYRRICRW